MYSNLISGLYFISPPPGVNQKVLDPKIEQKIASLSIEKGKAHLTLSDSELIQESKRTASNLADLKKQ